MLNRRWALIARPNGVPTADHLRLVEGELRPLRDGELTLKNFYLSLDPATRKRMDQAEGYLPAIPLGSSPTTTVLAEVIESRNPDFRPGELVTSFADWAEYSVVEVNAMTVRIAATPGIPLTRHLSVLGITGMTAYFGLLDCGQPKPGETVLVSAAAGAVGSLVGQIAKLHGCRTVGIVGTQEKRRRAIEEFGFDDAVLYQERDAQGLAELIRQCCPQGVDISFENVGGPLLDASLLVINPGARIVLCGLIAQYNAEQPGGCQNLWQVIARSATMKGFLVKNYLDRREEALEPLSRWLCTGKLTVREHVETGIETVPAAFSKLFDGSNDGKMIVALKSP
jgi:NADPH-dependent curcumin reductase CurA